MPFQKGVAANPNGRPKGALNKKTRFEQALIHFNDEHVSRMLGVFYEAGLNGDVAAGKIFLEYTLPKADKRAEMVEETPKKDLSHLTDAELKQIINIANRGTNNDTR